MRSVFVFLCARDFFGSLFFALIVLHGWGIESVALAANLPDAGMKIFEPQKMTPAQAKAMFNNRLIRRSSVAAPPKVSPRSATLVPAKGISASSSTTTAASAGTAIPSADPNLQPEAIITRLGKTVTEPGGGVADFSASVTAQAVTTQAVSQAESEIAELARALRYHPVLIWEYVYHNIEYAPVFGVTRGPLGTLLERKGNSFDQSALMVALLQESGYNARFVHGQIQLNAQQLTQWLGIKDDAPIADNYLRKMGIPSVVVEGLSNQIQSVQLEHVWVVVNYLGADYILDPSLKIHQITSNGINIAAAMGFDEAGFLASALSGATQTTDSIQNINRTKIQSSLQGYAQNLSDYIKTTMPAATLDDVLGGKQIKPALWGGWQTTHPYEVAGSTVEWPIIPDVYRRSLRIEYAGIDVTVYSDQVFCKRLTLFTNQASQPELRLDGVVLGTGTGITPGQSTALTLSVDLPITGRPWNSIQRYTNPGT